MMGLVSATGFEVSLDSKRRPTLPAALLSQAHIEPGEELIATPAGEGMILLRSRKAALAQVRASIRAGFDTPPAEGVVERLQRDRARQHDRWEAHRGAPSESGDDQAAQRGAALLSHLGL